MSNLLRKYIKSYISESKLTPGTSSDPGSYSKFGGGYKGKNNQSPGQSGGHVHVELFKTKARCNDDGYYYQVVDVDGPTSDTATGETVVFCKINEKFLKYFPEELHEVEFISNAGSEGEQEVLVKAQNFCRKIINTVNTKSGNSVPKENIYTFNPAIGNNPSSF